ncbi:hypothetical protein ACEQ8H_002036 [Pleosporales sp. CAS-2024a]
MAAAVAAPPAPFSATQPSTHSCPACGTNIELDTGEMELARRRIAELEAQMEFLKHKATAAAVDKCADYEDQLRSLKGARALPQRSNTSDTLDSGRQWHDNSRPSTPSNSSSRPSRFSFLTNRLTSAPSASSSAPPPPLPLLVSADTDLITELERERALRAKAEERAQKVDSEIEELSVQLFSQANEMVATERKARAKLEERIEVLERKDRDKMARLERLEKAVTRIDRVKAMLNTPQGSGGMLLAPGGKR